MTSDKHILGISAYYHDSAAAVLRNGVIVAAAQEERFSRKKHDARFEGDLRVLEGLWRLVPLADGNGVIVVHEIRIQPKIPAPRWLVRRSLRKDLPDMLACIRGLANASADKRRIAADLKRCPGDTSGVLK